MSDQLAAILEQTLTLRHGLESKAERKYRIEMVNSYLDTLGRVYKRQELRSVYTRIIEEIYEDAIAFLSYRWEKMTFTNRVPKVPVTPLDWTFAEGLQFNSHLVLSNEKLEEMCLQSEVDVSAEDHQNCFKSIEESYARLPKLPTTYLLIMQTLDIIAFENYMSYVHTYVTTHQGWKLDEWVAIMPPEREHMSAAKIGFGFYAENSIFQNGKFYLKLTGYGKANGKPCAVFDYYCDHSRVRMQEKEREHVQRNGTSYYHGQVWLDLVRGDVERGTMLESYIALQEGEKKTPIHIRRKVLCEALTGEEV